MENDFGRLFALFFTQNEERKEFSIRFYMLEQLMRKEHKKNLSLRTNFLDPREGIPI